MNKRIQKGATLIELIMAIAIIGIAIFGVISVFRVTVNNSANPITKKQAVLISESLMEEILSKSFTKPDGGYTGPYDSASRDKFDTVTDYNNVSISPMTSLGGTSISGLNSYSATITTVNTALGSVASTDSILVTITVTGPNDTFVLKGYRLNYDN
jgi:MSHA pilin protein MshD